MANAAAVCLPHNAADLLTPCDRPRIPYIPKGAVLHRPHNAADLLTPCDRPRTPCILKGTVRYRPHNAADSLIPCDRARIADILNLSSLTCISHNTAGAMTCPADCARIPCILNAAAPRTSHNAADDLISIDPAGV